MWGQVASTAWKRQRRADITRALRRRCEVGQHLISLGTASVGLFIVRRGVCHCLIADPQSPGGRKNVATKRPGEVFGELSLLEPGRPTAADVVAGEDTEVLLLTPGDFAELSLEHIEFRRHLASSMPSYATYNFFFEQPLFRQAPHEFIQELLRLAKLEDHNAGSVLQHAQAEGNGLWFVQKGQLFATADGGKSITLEEKMCFGLESVVSKAVRWTVCAQTDTQLWHLTQSDCKVCNGGRAGTLG